MIIIRSFIRLARPTQWVKNTFVFVGLLFGPSYSDAALIAKVLLTFAGFCLVASAVYVINDIADREDDRSHPTKCERPIAAGEVSVFGALFFSAFLLCAGLAAGYLASLEVLAILSAYFVLNLAYSAGLKNVVILDVFIIAAGFLLRILAGTIGVGMEPTQWLFLCSLCLTLFLGFGKRRAELFVNGDHCDSVKSSRKVLRDYTPAMLDSMMATVAACAFVTYGLFTMSDQTIELHGTTSLIYTLPLVMYAMFRYFYMLHGKGKGNDPSEDLVRDPHVISAVILWSLATYIIIR